MKRNLFLLIAFIMLISQNALLAALPVTPSTDTGAGATWYRIKIYVRQMEAKRLI